MNFDMRIGIGIIFCFFAACTFANDMDKTDVTNGFERITLTENQIATMKGIANFLFSYKEHPENQTVNGQNKQLHEDTSIIPQKSEKILKVGIIRDNLPFTAMRNNSPVGFDVELIHLLAEEEGFTLEIVPINMSEIEEKVKKNTIDIAIGGIIKNTQNDHLIDYGYSYLNADIFAVTLKKPKKDSQKFSFENKSIGVIEGSFFENHIRQANIKSTTIISLRSNNEMIEKLLRSNQNTPQNIDILLTSSHIARDWNAKYPELELFPLKMENEIAIVAPKNSPWLSIFNNEIKKFIGSYKFSELMRHWSIEKI